MCFYCLINIAKAVGIAAFAVEKIAVTICSRQEKCVDARRVMDARITQN